MPASWLAVAFSRGTAIAHRRPVSFRLRISIAAGATGAILFAAILARRSRCAVASVPVLTEWTAVGAVAVGVERSSAHACRNPQEAAEQVGETNAFSQPVENAVERYGARDVRCYGLDRIGAITATDGPDFLVPMFNE